MHRAREWVGTGLSVLAGILVSLAIVQASQADYNNPALQEKETFAYWMDQGGFFPLTAILRPPFMPTKKR